MKSTKRDPNQLRLLMTAGELHAMHSIDVPRHPGERGRFPSMEAMWAHKQRDNAADGMTEHVKRHGVHVPVQLATGGEDLGNDVVISDGHHRVQAAFDDRPDQYVAVDYKDFGSRRIPTRAEEDAHAAVLGSVPDWEPRSRFPNYP